MGTFGSHLQHFARSVDIVDTATLVDARQMIWDYLREQLDAVYFEVTLEHWVNDAVGLKTSWSSANRDFSIEIRQPDGGYSSQVALSFGTRRPLWVVSTDRGPLRVAGSYQDMWSHLSDLPKYRPPIDEDLYTSVLMPMLRPGTRVAGVMYIETSRYLDIADFDRHELSMLADALGVLVDLRQLNDVQAQGTRDAVGNLRRIKEEVAFPQIAKPQVFVAYSARADQRAVGLLLDELNKLSDRLRIRQWDRIDDSGMISAQIADAISSSQFGVCYLSEPDGEGAFRDNPNVLFEAGMLHALSLATHDQATWLPIREERSPPVPFDFAGDRIALVPRTGEQVNEQLFRSRLQDRLRAFTSGRR